MNSQSRASLAFPNSLAKRKQSPASSCRSPRFGFGQGFSLVEVLVAMAIGMVTVVVIMQTLSNLETQRRQAGGGSSAGTAGALALQTLQRDLMSAGSGLTGEGNLLFNTCYAQQFRAYNSQRVPTNVTFPTQSFAPIRVWASDAPPAHLNAAGGGGFDADTDIIQVVSGGSRFFAGKGIDVTSFAQPTDFANAQVSAGTLDPTWNPVPGLHSGDMVIAVEAGSDCVLAQLTSISVQGRNTIGEFTPPSTPRCDAPVAVTTAAARINHAAGTQFRNFHNNCDLEPVSYWNQPGAATLGVAFSSAKLFSLGSADRVSIRAYAIRSGNLTVCSPLYQNCTLPEEWQVSGDGVVSMRAQYGYDANADQTVAPGTVPAGEWQTPADFDGLGAAVVWRQLKALRVVLVARGKDISRAPVDGADCAPVWTGFTVADNNCAAGAADGKILLSSGYDGANWARYRYKVFETTVQLRNLYWSE